MAKSMGNSKSVKRANSFLVLNTIRRYGPTTHDEIVKMTNLSSPTVRYIISELLEEEVIIKSGLSESTGGRQAMLLSINADSQCAIGINFGSDINMIVSNLNGEVIYSCKREYWNGDTVHSIINIFFEMIDAFFEKANIKSEDVVGICLGVPGVLDYDEGISISIPELNNWENVRLRSIFENRYDISTFVLNEVHLMSCAENRISFLNQNANFIFIACKEKLGASIIINGELYRGMHGNAGIIEDYKLEDVADSEIGISEFYVAKYSLIPKKAVFFQNLSNEDLSSGEMSGLVSRAGDYLAEKISLLIKALDITDIILGGPYSEVNKVLIPSMLKSVQMRIPFSIARMVTIRTAKLNYDQSSIGGCYYVIEQYFEEF